RGHGRSDPAPARDAYTYELLGRDLEEVIAYHAPGRALLAGSSMGAHTAIRFALANPQRVAALVLITPGYDPEEPASPDAFDGWGAPARGLGHGGGDARARGLREGGIEGFVEAYGLERVDARWRATVETAIRQRMAAHEHP